MALRILHVAPYGPEAWAYGGIPRVVGAMADGLQARGHAVAVCTTDALDAQTRLPRGLTVPGPQRYVFPNVSNRAAYHLQAFAPIGLSGFLQSHASSFDVAHIHACHHVLGIMASRALTRPLLRPSGALASLCQRDVGAAEARALDAARDARRVEGDGEGGELRLVEADELDREARRHEARGRGLVVEAQARARGLGDDAAAEQAAQDEDAGGRDEVARAAAPGAPRDLGGEHEREQRGRPR